jgi:UDP-glucose 4-epimerase
MATVLVCGGAGYIGSHMMKMLAEQGHVAIAFDNLSTGHRSSVRWGTLIQGDLLDSAALSRLFNSQPIDLVMHFSASSLVGESLLKPLDYYRNNVTGSINLLRAMAEAGVARLVFSSTAAVYGVPQQVPIREDSPLAPINPYGHSKRMVEQILQDCHRSWGLDSVCLRYFNAAGADPQGRIGEAHDPETHLIPNAIRALLGRSPELQLYGDDYPTADGTCVRDYIHVDDLCRAHLLAMDWLATHGGAERFNLGNGSGFSVREVLASVARAAGSAVPYRLCPRRPGDPPVLVADSSRARQLLCWRPQYDHIDPIVQTAWEWHQQGEFRS